MKINRVVVSAVLLVVLAVAVLPGCGLIEDPDDMRAWEYGSGEEIQLGDDRSIVLQPKFTAYFDVPVTHRPGEPDPAFLHLKVRGPSEEMYVVGAYPQARAGKNIQSTKRFVELGEYPSTKMDSLTIDGVRIDLSVTDDSEDVDVDAFIWSGDCDPLWITAMYNPGLTRMVRKAGSSEEIIRFILDGVGLQLNGAH